MLSTGNKKVDSVIVLPIEDGRVLLPRSRTGGAWYYHLLVSTRKSDETVEQTAHRVTASRTGLVFNLESELSRSVSSNEPMDPLNMLSEKLDVTHVIFTGTVSHSEESEDKSDCYEWFELEQAIEQITPIAQRLISYAKAVEALRQYPR